jgi:hypothetical protein
MIKARIGGGTDPSAALNWDPRGAELGPPRC